MRAALDPRLRKLEAMVAAETAGCCRECGLRHVRPLTIALLRGVVRVAGGTERETLGGPLCLCGCCTGEPRDAWIGSLSHGSEIGTAH